MMKFPPKPEASETSPKPHAQLVGLQFYMALTPLAHSCTISAYTIVIPIRAFFLLPASQTPPYLLPSSALVDKTVAEGEAV